MHWLRIDIYVNFIHKWRNVVLTGLLWTVNGLLRQADGHFRSISVESHLTLQITISPIAFRHHLLFLASVTIAIWSHGWNRPVCIYIYYCSRLENISIQPLRSIDIFKNANAIYSSITFETVQYSWRLHSLRRWMTSSWHKPIDNFLCTAIKYQIIDHLFRLM